MLVLFKKLHNIRLLTPAGLYYLLKAICTHGVNLMTLLHLAAELHDRKIAVTDEMEDFSHRDLYNRARNLAAVLQTKYGLQAKRKTAIICRNHAAFIQSIFAVSRLGSDIYLLNPEMSAAQLAALHDRHSFDFVIYDAEISELINDLHLTNNSIITYHDTLPSVNNSAKIEPARFPKIKKIYSSNLIILTGGTTGEPKTARRKASLLNFLNPFFALLTELNLDERQSVYVATPVYHGFGVAAVFIALVTGSRMFLMPRFDAGKGCALIERYQIEVVTLVPLMLQRMLTQNVEALKSLLCIISGGAPLNPTLVEETFEKLGDRLFNLYGTSEAGFSVLATPADLRRSPNTIGKAISGLKLRITTDDNDETAAGTVGRICIKSRWAVKDSGDKWIETGDLGYRDAAGYCFLRGRIDEMIVSGGENVYPVELENILVNHPEIRQAAVIGVSDAEFGQRLKVFVVPAADSRVTPTDIIAWLNGRVARFQMPVSVEILRDLPVTSVGKINKKILS